MPASMKVRLLRACRVIDEGRIIAYPPEPGSGLGRAPAQPRAAPLRPLGRPSAERLGPETLIA